MRSAKDEQEAIAMVRKALSTHISGYSPRRTLWEQRGDENFETERSRRMAEAAAKRLRRAVARVRADSLDTRGRDRFRRVAREIEVGL